MRAQLLAVAEAASIPVRDAWFDQHSTLLLSLTSVPDFSNTAQLLVAAGAEVRCDVTAVSAIANTPLFSSRCRKLASCAAAQAGNASGFMGFAKK